LYKHVIPLYNKHTVEFYWILATYFEQDLLGASRDMDDFARDDFLLKLMSDFERLRRYYLLELRGYGLQKWYGV